ncbi:hypothetical protein LTR35_018225 [Friedmanniomyces endolithicus]|uniref:Major facilitator superfamily (MFS) profile domain-containing protein n=1 Tax=Friedmanniomyces endolithicus TaxID=329885 RepID=A0AAN6F4W1_9PEZI|nr:hypothetical protein LTR35_018225 [Friedmanniomyces endolithicus]KAK0261567.1 hypothetical protein LTS00_018140 [Friedmanniomyces endolithicus]KAK0301530.1 hypothetical protein LTR82_018272 [Friedmanniomyces endolithicus]KAK0967264.1 hypothetical protein LTR54_018285 [Friedmanniomyces endolithicus]
MPLNPKVYQFLVSIFASVGSILYGYDLGVIAGAIASPDFKSRFTPTTSESGAVVSFSLAAPSSVLLWPAR